MLLSKRIYGLLLLTFLFGLRFAHGHNPYNLQFSRINRENGLSQNTVYFILPDHKGLIWIGTQDGLNLYNGYRFMVFRGSPNYPFSISNKHVISGIQDSKGILWFGTSLGGINSFDSKTGQFEHHPHQDGSKIIWAGCFAETAKGELWIGTQGQGLYYYDRDSKTYTQYNHNENNLNSLSNNHVTKIAEDNDGMLWVGTHYGLNRFDPVSKTYTHYYDTPGTGGNLSSSVVNDLIIASDGTIWIATNLGLNHYNPKNQLFKTYKHAPRVATTISNNIVTCIHEDGLGRLWVGTQDGLNLFTPQTGKFSRYYSDPFDPLSIPENHIISISEDKSGVVWIGTENNGLCNTPVIPKGFITLRQKPNRHNSLNDNIVRCIYDDPALPPNLLWVGTTTGGLNLFNRDKESFTAYRHNPNDKNSLSNNTVNAVLRDSHNVLWIGTAEGLNRFDHANGKFYTYSHFERNSNGNNSQSIINTLYEDKQGNLWLGTETEGLVLYNRQNHSVTAFKPIEGDSTSISSASVRAILEDSYGTLWVGTLNELNIFDRNTKKFTVLKYIPNDTTTIKSECIMSILEDSSGKIWIGTTEGFNLYNREQNTLRRFSGRHGLPNNTVYGIVEDNSGNLWLSTNLGISKFNTNTFTFRNYDVSDGIQGNEFNYGAYQKSSTGELYFGGTNGFTLFNPEDITNNPYCPPVMFTELMLFNQPVMPGVPVNGKMILTNTIDETPEIVLSYHHKIFSIEYAALSFVSATRNSYAYKLEGLEKEWNYVGGIRTASYSTLPPNTYTFRVKASNNDGVWNEVGRSIRIVVTPPWWKTKVFYIAVLISLTGIIYLAVRLRLKSLRVAKENLEKEVELRIKDIHEVNTILEEQQAELEMRQEKIVSQADWLMRVNEDLKKLSIVASETSNGVSIYDKNGNIEWYNSSFEKLHGSDFDCFENLKGKNILDCSDNPDFKEYYDRCLTTRQSVTYETKHSFPNTTLWIQTTLTPIYDDKGNLDKLVAVDTDVTERILAQNELLLKTEEIVAQNEELELHRNNLEELVKNRTAELELAKEKAEEANRLKTAFLTNMSHEIRTPMNAIVGFSTFLTNPECNEDDRKECIEQINSNAETLLNLINDIIDISKIQANQLSINTADFDLHGFLTELFETFQNDKILKAKELALRLRPFDIENRNIETDKYRLRQILSNIISNAIKFTDKGFVEFGYEVKGKMLEFFVKDTGIGISGPNKERVFTRFTKIEEDKTKIYPGTGLGLSISKNLVKLLGGHIWVESEENIGSTFYFTIPYHKSQTVETQPQKSKHILSFADEYNWHNYTILVAEDEDANFTVLKKFLRKTKVTLIRAENGLEAVNLFKRDSKGIHLVLMDIKMPVMNGIEALKLIRQLNPNIPVIAQTAFALDNEVEEIVEQGFNELIIKPIEPEMLLKSIAKYLA